MHRLLMIFLLTGSLLLSAFASAETADLYTIEEAVIDQSPEALADATVVGLQNVLVRLVGDTESLRTPDQRDLVTDAESWLLRHHYIIRNKAEMAQDNTAPEQYAVQLTFDSAAINAALTEANIPLWTTRQPILLVAVVADEQGKHILTESDTAAHAVITQVETKYGVDVWVPVMDLADSVALDAEKLWRGDMAGAVIVAQRYDATTIVLLRAAKQANGDWQAQWQTQWQTHEKPPQNWQSEGNYEAMLRAGLKVMTAKLVQESSHAPSKDAQTFSLSVLDVNGLSAYQRVMDYFQALTYAENVQQQGLANGMLQLTFNYRGTQDQLVKILKNEGVLAAEPDYGDDTTLFWRLK